MKKKSQSTDEVEVMRVGDQFHLFTKNPKFTFYNRRKIPKWLWDLYAEAQPQAIDLRRRIERYFRPVKDKPMTVVKITKMNKIEDEFDLHFPSAAMTDMQRAYMRDIKDWLKSYIRDFAESVKLEKKTNPNNLAGDPSKWDISQKSYNAALSDHQAKISEELKARGI